MNLSTSARGDVDKESQSVGKHRATSPTVQEIVEVFAEFGNWDARDDAALKRMPYMTAWAVRRGELPSG